MTTRVIRKRVSFPGERASGKCRSLHSSLSFGGVIRYPLLKPFGSRGNFYAKFIYPFGASRQRQKQEIALGAEEVPFGLSINGRSIGLIGPIDGITVESAPLKPVVATTPISSEFRVSKWPRKWPLTDHGNATRSGGREDWRV